MANHLISPESYKGSQGRMRVAMTESFKWTRVDQPREAQGEIFRHFARSQLLFDYGADADTQLSG